jgi:hypothetical protein
MALMVSTNLVTANGHVGSTSKPRSISSAAVTPGETIEITLEGKRFHPDNATVKDGDVIRICNKDTFYHSPFSYSKYNQFGKTKGERIASGECMTRVARNPTSENIPFAIFDELHSYEKLSLTVLPATNAGGLSGAWRIVQTADNGAKYTGTLRLHQEGDRLTGRAEWDNHTQGNLSGSVQEGRIRFSIEYGEGLVGTYQADLNSEGNQMVNGQARSNKSEAVVRWQASRQ